jgi:hypothetical protein
MKQLRNQMKKDQTKINIITIEKNENWNEKQNIREIVIEWQNWKKKQNFYKRNKDEIRNSKNEDWNWKTINKEDNCVH